MAENISKEGQDCCPLLLGNLCFEFSEACKKCKHGLEVVKQLRTTSQIQPPNGKK